MQVNPCDLTMCLWYSLDLLESWWNFLIFPAASTSLACLFKARLHFLASHFRNGSFLMLTVAFSNCFSSLEYLVLSSLPSNIFRKKSIPT